MKEKIWLTPELVESTALAQHYGVITRIPDWFPNLSVALYFTCIGGMKRLQEGGEGSAALWAINAKDIQTNEQYLYTCGKDSCPLELVVPSYYANQKLKAQKGVLVYWQITNKKAADRTSLEILIKDVRNFHEDV